VRGERADVGERREELALSRREHAARRRGEREHADLFAVRDQGCRDDGLAGVTRGDVRVTRERDRLQRAVAATLVQNDAPRAEELANRPEDPVQRAGLRRRARDLASDLGERGRGAAVALSGAPPQEQADGADELVGRHGGARGSRPRPRGDLGRGPWRRDKSRS